MISHQITRYNIRRTRAWANVLLPQQPRHHLSSTQTHELRISQSTAPTAQISHATKETKVLRKSTQLKNMLQSQELSFFMEAHNGLSARIVEETGFAGIWGSGLSMSASLGVRDSNEASWTQVMDQLEFMTDCTKIPILLDGDTGYGNFNNARRLVKKLEQRDIAGVCIEDKLFPKSNSFVDGPQTLADIREHCGKIAAMKDTQIDADFQVVARLESFIAGRGLYDALERAYAYSEAGADAILVHSKISTECEIAAFIREWDFNKPIVIVPTKYWQTPTQTFSALGVSSVIWANHNLRTCIDSMKTISRTIFEEQSLRSVEQSIATVSDIFFLQNNDELKNAEKRYLNFDARKNKHRHQTASASASADEMAAQSPPPRVTCQELYATLARFGVHYYCGVPDSLMKNFLNVVDAETSSNITCNEGLAVSLAAGHYLSHNGRSIPCVYLQNSGFGNTLNPILSLLRTYDIPLLFVMGWRGQPGVKDEPQHLYQGQCTEALLQSAHLKYCILDCEDRATLQRQLHLAFEYMKREHKPYFFLLEKDSFPDEVQPPAPASTVTTDESMARAAVPADADVNEVQQQRMLRYNALRDIAHAFNDQQAHAFVSNVGYTSRELWHIRDQHFEGRHCQDFYMIGSMGHCSSLALAIALNNPRKTVIAIDGDGALLMHMGSLATIGTLAPSNLIHFMINNGTHESVGKQVISNNVNYTALAESVGYPESVVIDSEADLKSFLKRAPSMKGPIFVELKCDSATIENLPRPTTDFIKHKFQFMQFLDQ